MVSEIQQEMGDPAFYKQEAEALRALLRLSHQWKVRAQAAEATLSRVEALVADAEKRSEQSLARTFGGGRFPGLVAADDLRAALGTR